MSAAMRFVRLALAAIGAVAIGDSAAAADSVSAGALPPHLGVASCAASACHGKIAALTNVNVALNEYRTWLLSDRHSQAFRILQPPKAGAIAAKLRLAEATAAKVCLDCHADNLPTELR